MLLEHSSPQLLTVGFASPFQQLLQQQRVLLSSFNSKNKWQLWISERPMLKRSWVDIAGLDRQKVMHITHIKQNMLIDTIEKALLSKNYSYIVACVSQLHETDKQRLQQAIQVSHTYLFLVNDDE